MLNSYGPPQQAGLARYVISLVIFFTPVALGWAWPCVGPFLRGVQKHLFVYAIGGDSLLLIGLFVFGGPFWDRLRPLFIHGAYAVIPARESGHG